jgi:hypothetical protein
MSVIFILEISVTLVSELSEFPNKVDPIVPVPKKLQLNKHNPTSILKPSKPSLHKKCHIRTETTDQ